MKIDRWYNFGDVSHREEGLQAVRKTDENEFDVVTIDINPDFIPISEPDFPHEKAYNTIQRQYIVQSYTGLSTDTDRIFVFDEKVLSYAGWQCNPETDEDKARYCTDYIRYYGGDCEVEMVSNYYKELRSWGIYRI